MSKKNVFINFVNTGAEYCYGYVEPGEENDLLREKIEEGEDIQPWNSFENADGDDVEINFYDYDQLLHVFGPAIGSGMSVTMEMFDSEDTEKKNALEGLGVEGYDQIDNYPVNYFTTSNPYPGDLEDVPEGSLFFGGYVVEKNIHYPVTVKLNENEDFDWSKIFIGTMNMDETLSSDEVITDILYIREEEATKLLQLYLGDNYNPEEDTIGDFLNEIYNEDYEEKEEVFKIIESCLVEVDGDIEGGGTSKGESVIIKDMDEETLYELSY